MRNNNHLYLKYLYQITHSFPFKKIIIKFTLSFLLLVALLVPILSKAQLKKREIFYDANRTHIQESYFVTIASPYLKNGICKLYNQNTVLTEEAILKMEN
jgi:hypothetical protein